MRAVINSTEKFRINRFIETVEQSDIMEVPPDDAVEILNNLPAQHEFHGNEIKRRSAYLPSGAKKSWIDADTPLASGWLKEFWFFTHNMSNTELPPGVSNMRLQIWRQQGDSDSYMYRLRWEYRVAGLEWRSANGKEWRVSIPIFFSTSSILAGKGVPWAGAPPWLGTPHPDLAGGTPGRHSLAEDTPIQTWPGGTPGGCPLAGVPLVLTWPGVPQAGTPWLRYPPF